MDEVVILLPEFARLMAQALHGYSNLLDSIGEDDEAATVDQMATLLHDAIDAARNRN